MYYRDVALEKLKSTTNKRRAVPGLKQVRLLYHNPLVLTSTIVFNFSNKRSSLFSLVIHILQILLLASFYLFKTDQITLLVESIDQNRQWVSLFSSTLPISKSACRDAFRKLIYRLKFGFPKVKKLAFIWEASIH